MGGKCRRGAWPRTALYDNLAYFFGSLRCDTRMRARAVGLGRYEP